jgi:hypothetical protein
MRMTTRTAATAAAVVMLAAGCTAGHGSGSAVGTGGSSGTGGSGSQARMLAVSKRPASWGPQTISSQQTGSLARSLLAQAPLPRGAKVRQGRAPAALNQASGIEMGRPSIELHKLWTVAQPMSMVHRFWNGHAPAGMAWNGSGQGEDHGVITQESAGYDLKRLPTGVYAAMLSMSVVPAGQHTSVIRADVQVIWYPPRSTAEYLPAGTGAVTITASALNPRPHSVTKTITTRSVIQRLAAMLNGAYAMPRGSFFSCPLESVTYRLAFAKSAGAAPFLVTTDTGCPGLGITVGGHQQPDLEIPAALQKLLGSLTPIAVSLGRSSGGPVHTQPK